MKLALDQLLRGLPPAWPERLAPAIRGELLASGRCIVVLDDDPTGTQTVSDTPVLTTWDLPALEAELGLGSPLFYVLTNSRSLSTGEAEKLGRELSQVLARALAPEGLVPEPRRTFGGLDASWLVHHGVPMLTIGAGGENAHTPQEQVVISAFHQATRVVARLMSADP